MSGAPIENGPKSPDCPDKPERPRRRVAMNVAFLLATAALMGLLAWVAHQIDCFRREHKAKTILEAEVYPGALGLTSLASVYGPTAEEAPYLSLSELQHGRLYAPIMRATVGGGGWPKTKAQTLDQEAWDHLRSFRYLERLQVSWCNIDPDVDADFSGFTHLRFLAITDAAFLPRHIRTLAQLPQLQDVMLEKKQGIDEWLPCIGQLRQIRSLEIEGDVSDQAVHSLAGLETLESLCLESDRITSNVVPALARLKNLKALTLTHTRIDDEGLRQLAALKGLKQLHLRASDGISDHGVVFLAALEALEDLTLNSNRITSKSAPTLARLKNLKGLLLPNTRIDDEGLRRLTELNQLDGLVLAGTEITHIGAELRFPRLGYLDLTDTNLTDVGLRYVSQCPKLRCLVIPGTRVTNASIETLAAMPSLMQVYAYDTQIDEDNIEWLRLMKTLETRRAKEEQEQAP